MKLAISNIAWTAADDQRVYSMMKQYGFSGLEIAPTRIFPENPYRNLEQANEWANKLKNEFGFAVPSMQSIWYGRQEKLFGSDEERIALVNYTKKAIDFAQIVGCHNLVFGCPRNRNFPEGASLNTGITFFKEIGDYAYSKGSVIGMEPNPLIYNTNYINDTMSALKLIEEVSSPGFLLNLDIGTMIENEESVAMLSGKVNLINHVHISEPNLKPIQRRKIHKELSALLRNEGYQGYVSIEMGKTDDFSVITSVLQYVKEVFA